jgi:excinuclease UvrABC nuclease subunit
MQITWSGFHSLNDNNVKQNVPSQAGVYLLWVQLKNEKWRCHYVGQAENLQERLLAHCSQDEQNDCINNNVQNYTSGYEFAKVSKQVDRDAIEKYLYDYYKPQCNKQDPGGRPMEVNLP